LDRGSLRTVYHPCHHTHKASVGWVISVDPQDKIVAAGQVSLGDSVAEKECLADAPDPSMLNTVSLQPVASRPVSTSCIRFISLSRPTKCLTPIRT
jgi:hypothetical protein